jgi:hypothetical protein
LDADELLGNLKLFIGFQVRLNRFSGSGKKLVHCLGLGVATGQPDDLGYKPTLLIFFDDNRVFSRHVCALCGADGPRRRQPAAANLRLSL